MPFCVYVIQSLKDGCYYRGYSEDVVARLAAHNAGESRYTRDKIPWQLVYVEELASKREGLIREKVLKKYSRAQIEQLLGSSKNIVVHFTRTG